MSIFKQFLASDIIVTPFKVNKNFTFIGAHQLTSSNVGIDRFLGVKTGSLFSTSDPTTGQFYTSSYQRLVYNSIKELYYSNFITSSIGDEAPITYIDNGVILSESINQPRYENYLQSTLAPQRYIPTGSGDLIGVISIPVRLFGETIRPKTFTCSTPSGSLIDDGEGNIYYTIDPYVNPNYVDEGYFVVSSSLVGNIIYPHGIVTITQNYITAPTSGSSIYASASYGTGYYGGFATLANNLNLFITSSNVTMSFSSTYTIYESQYKCTIRESEFNSSYNPTLLTGSLKDTQKDFSTGSYFNPYITMVGLYNDQQELLAIAKFAQPIPSNNTTNLNLVIGLDRV